MIFACLASALGHGLNQKQMLNQSQIIRKENSGYILFVNGINTDG